jgi:hypothetical protein
MTHRILIPAAALLALAAPAFAQRTHSAADQAAIFKAAGFKLQSGKYTRCAEDPSASHQFATIEAVDLNGDGAPEAIVREASTFCYGATEQATVVAAKDKTGAWKILLDEVGADLVEKTKTNGWLDITIGGPGMGPQPLYKYNGAKYAARR